MKKPIIIIGIIIVVTSSIFFLNQTKPEEKKNATSQFSVSTAPSLIQADKEVDYTAGFAIFTNGTFRIFTAPMYHNQSEDVFIESSNPNIVRVKKADITWDDFFKTLPFKLAKDCLTTGTGQTFCTNSNGKLSFYLNNIEDSSVLEKQINKGDRLLVTYGNENEEQIQLQLQKIPLLR